MMIRIITGFSENEDPVVVMQFSQLVHSGKIGAVCEMVLCADTWAAY